MAINRALWNPLFSREAFPRLPCPRCATGRVILDKDSLTVSEPKYSKSMHSHDAWEPDWTIERFSGRMVCEEGACGEIVFMSGDTEVVEVYIEEDGYEGPGLAEALRPRSIFPGSPLFPIPTTMPSDASQELKLAFQLYWTDLSASLGRLRTSIERMLDDQGVVTSGLDKNGKVFTLNLFQRISAFQKMATGADAALSLQSLRNVGNIGTHGGEIDAEVLFDAMDVYEDVLLGIYEKKSILAKAKNLGSL